ncbi:hypothetical protein GCM10010170_077320 [Dactylosporangium salmoneum]|uniref:YncI copper-binding domain-containing protein n=1 Tax=Dactylosporangium salmoneum TaxID=53361 RepID=A0ABN3HAM4_9ACTN
MKVAADKAQAGARDVTITFTGEGESSRAGIEAERVVLPAGIAVADVELVSAPPGWTFTAAEDGYTVSGPALRPRADAVHTIRVARLPATARALAFKTLETYSDGSVARWIDLPEAGNPEPEHPAPVLALRPAAAQSVTGAPAAGPSATGGAPDIAGPDIAQPAPTEGNTTGTLAAIGLMTVALLLVAGVLVLVVVVRRRSTTR